MVLRFLVMATACALCLCPSAEAATGKAVYYKPPYTPSACYQNADKGTYVTGVKKWLWNNGKVCGQRYTVRCIGSTFDFPNACTGRSVTVTVVDFCKEPCNGDFNLSQDAFSVIGNLTAGNIRIDYSPA